MPPITFLRVFSIFIYVCRSLENEWRYFDALRKKRWLSSNLINRSSIPKSDDIPFESVDLGIPKATSKYERLTLKTVFLSLIHSVLTMCWQRIDFAYLLFKGLQFFFVREIHHSQHKVKQIERAEENGDHEVKDIPHTYSLDNLRLQKKKCIYFLR